MKNKKHFRTFSVMLAAVVCLCGFTVTAYANDNDDHRETEQTQPAETTTAPLPLTPEGNMSLVDDISGDAAGDKQFIVVQSKNGNYFYIIIDNAAEGENSVHFLNQVDEADLLAIIDEDSEAEITDTPAVCTCTDKCEIGKVNTGCTVCSINLNDCIGTASTTQTEETEQPAEQDTGNNMSGLIIFLAVGLLAGGGAFYYFKVMKPKQTSKGSKAVQDFDFDDYDEDEAPEYEEQEDVEDE